MSSSHYRVAAAFIFAVTVLAAILVKGHWTEASTRERQSAIIARAEDPDEPWIKLQTRRSVAQIFVDATAKADTDGLIIDAQTRSLTDARPLSLASGDLNDDGFPDLICGYAVGNGGLVSIQHGNPRSYAPEDPEVLRGIGRGEFPDPFMSRAGYVELPERPDFLAAMDIDRDGQTDIVTAMRGSSGLYVLAGDGHGGFSLPQLVSLPGVVTSMTTGKIDQADGTTSLILGLNTQSGFAIAIYENTKSLLKTQPVIHSSPAEITSVATGRLDDDQFDDVAFVAGGQAFILHGHGQNKADARFADRMAGQIEAIDVPFAVRAMGIGTFIWSRDGAQQLALMADDGTVHIAAHGQLDTHPFTADEMASRRLDLEKKRVEMEAASKQGKIYVARDMKRPVSKSWGVVEDLAAPAVRSFAAVPNTDSLSSAGGSPILMSTRISALPSDDLVIMDPITGNFQVSYNENSRPGTELAKTPLRSAVDLASAGEPVAVLPMRVGVDGRPGLVVLTNDSFAPTILSPQAAVTYHVTAAAIPDATTSCSAPVGGISSCTTLRAAIIASNTNVGADTIVFDTNGTYTLSLTGSDNAAAVGDLDVNDSLTITGNGSANTIISTNYTTGCGDCKVFGVNQDGSHTNLTVSITGVTIQNGFNDYSATCQSTFEETGGGVDFFLTGTTAGGNSYSITNSVITNNKAHSATPCSSRHGGGLNVDSAGQATPAGANIGTVTFTNDTFTSNAADYEGGGLSLPADKHNVTMTNCTIGGASVANGNTSGGTISTGGGIWTRHSYGGTVTIDGGSFQNNKATATVTNVNGFGGGIAITGNQVTNIGVTSGVSFTNNTATESGGGTSTSLAGGIGIANLGAAGVTGSTQISNSTISANHADNGTAPQGGGIYFNSNYSAIVSACTIGSSGNPNTSTRGAGVFNGGSGSTPVSTLTLNSGTTVSFNTATGSGGGIANTDSLGSSTILNGITVDSNTSGSGGDGIDQSSDSNNTGSIFTLQGTINVNGGDSVFLSQTNGTFTSTSGTLNITGNFTHSAGTFTHNSGTVNFNGSSAETIGGSVNTAFNNLTINNSSGGVGLTASKTVNGALTLTSGALGVSTNTLTLNNTVNYTSGSISSSASGTVSYNQGSNGQNVAPGSYGNLTFSNFNKVLPTGIVGVAGTFTPGSGTPSVLGSVISFNGTAAQTIPVFPYDGLTLNNAAGASLAGATTVKAALTLTSGELTTGANTLTVDVNGTASRTSGLVIGTVNKNYSAPGSFTYPIGTTGAYTPVDATVTAGSGNLSAKATAAIVTTSPQIDGNHVIHRYWTMSGSGVTSDVTWHYLQTDVFGTETSYWILKVFGGTTTRGFQPNGTDHILDTTNNLFTMKGLTTYSDWLVGEPLAPVAATVSISGRVLTSGGVGVAKSRVTLTDTDGNVVSTLSSAFGFYQFDGVQAGRTYIVSVSDKRHTFSARSVSLSDDLTGFDLTADP